VSESRVIEFLPEHLLGFDDIEGRLDKVNRLEIGEFHKKAGPSASFEVDGKIVMCGGLHLLWEGVGESWMVLREGCIGPNVMLAARTWLDATIVKHKLIRVAAVIPVGAKWARTERFLRFGYEGTMRKFGPGGVDKALWARVT
jgi:hypothetical protein